MPVAASFYAPLAPAVCRTDPDAWFPAKGESGSEALTACRHHCPILAQCRSWALANPRLASDGIWGGMTPGQRAAHRRTRLERAA